MGKVDRVVGVGFIGAGSFVQNRITGAFDGIRERFKDLESEQFVRIEGRGMREASKRAMSELLRSCRPGEHTLVAAATDSSALGVLDAVREAGLEAHFAIVGQDCIPEVMAEMRRGGSAIIGSISHEPETYGPRLIQLGIAILRGYTVPPYNYVHHKAVTPETLGDAAKAHNAKREEAALVGQGVGSSQ
jgi:ribose transport system substrate-binding protein